MKKILINLIIISIFCLTACSEKNNNEEVNPISDRDNSITTFGVVKCSNTKSIVLPFNTSIKRVLAGEGEEVVKGQSLIEFDLLEYNLQIEKMQNEIDRLKQELVDLEVLLKALQNQTLSKTNNLSRIILSLNNKLSATNSYIKTGLSPEHRKLALTLETAQNDLSVEKTNLSDCKTLYDAGAVSLKDYQEQQRNVKAKEQKINEIKLEIEALNQKYKVDADSLEISIHQNEIELTDLKADMSNQERELNALIKQCKNLLSSEEAEMQKLTDRVNMASIQKGFLVCDMKRAAVESIKFNPGDSIAAGNIIANLLELDSLYVEVGIEEQSISQVHVGAKVQIIPEMDKTKFYTGKVSFVSSLASVKNNETVISIKVSIDNPDKFLLPNSNVKIKILPA